MDDPERRVLRSMPELFLAGAAPAACFAHLVHHPLAQIVALAFACAYSFLLVPLALSCLIIGVLKRRDAT